MKSTFKIDSFKFTVENITEQKHSDLLWHNSTKRYNVTLEIPNVTSNNKAAIKHGIKFDE